MALIDRLAGLGNPETNNKLPVFAFHALLEEMANGEKTQTDIVDYFLLDAGEQTELQFLIDRYNAQPNATARAKFVGLMKTIFILAEANVSGYINNTDLVARINRI